MCGKKILLGLLLVLLACGLLWATGQSEEGTGKEKTVTLRVTTRGDAGSMDRDKIRVREFEKRFPNIKIQQEPWPAARFHEFSTQLAVQYESGTAADVVAMDFEPLEHVIYDRLLPLSNFMESDEEFQSWEYWDPGQLEQYNYFGDYYALPRGLYTYLFWVNVDLFEEAGIPVPGWDWDFTDFVSIAKQLTLDKNGDGNMDQYGVHIYHTHPDFYNPFINPPDEKECAWYTYDDATGFVDGSNMDHENIVQGMQFIADLVNKHKVTPSPALGDVAATGLTFSNGKMAIDASGATWSMGGFRAEIKDFEWKAVPQPSHTPGQPCDSHHVLQRPTGAIMASTEHPREAWEFLKFYSGPEIEKIVYEESEYIEFGGPRFKDSLMLEDWVNMDPPGKESTQLLLDIILEDRFNWAVENIVPQGNERFVHLIVDNNYTLLTGEETAKEWVDRLYPKAQEILEWTTETEKIIAEKMGN